MALILNGRAAAEEFEREAAEAAAAFTRQHGRQPGLTVVLVGDDPASATYVRNKERAAEAAGIRGQTRRLPSAVTTEELLAEVHSLNEDDSIDGILVQLPLPDSVDEERVLAAVDFQKDVDGFHTMNMGLLLQGKPCLSPCTPTGIMRLLELHDIPVAGAEAVVLGRSLIVGKPMALMLLGANATVTVCHSRTKNLAEVTSRADILVAAVGRAGLVDRSYVKEGAVVVDVGMNRVDDPALAERLWGGTKRFERFQEKGSILVGDVHYNDVEPIARAITPVPGGVGPLTVAQLLSNTVAAGNQRIAAKHSS